MQAIESAGQDRYGGADPRCVPIYSVGQVAHHLGVAPSTVRSWVRSGPAFERVVVPADGVGLRLSFQNLIEIHVLSSLRGFSIPLPKIRFALFLARKFYQTEHPLADVELLTDRREIFADVFGSLVTISQGPQTAMRPVFEKYLERIDKDEHGLLARLYPFVDAGSDDSKVIAIDPRRRFGKPYLVGVGVETSEIFSRYRAGENIAEIAEDFDATVEQIQGAIRFETRNAA